MSFFEKLFSKFNKKTTSDIVQFNNNSHINPFGFVDSQQMDINDNNINFIKNRFIAFDIETTGLNSQQDRIVEVGAVLFENGKVVDSYESLVNAKVNISADVTRLNNITNRMIKNAPSENQVYYELVNFLGDALNGKTPVCAHNAKFDMGFLCNTLSRLGYNGEIKYLDTLSLSRKNVKGLRNYKQNTVAEYFNLQNKNSHRAKSDAIICGNILTKLFFIIENQKSRKSFSSKNNKISPEELEVCAVIQNIIFERKGDTDLVGYYKNSSGYIDVYYLYKIVRFKFTKKGKYIIVPRDLKGSENFILESCTLSEGGHDFVRLYFNSPLEVKEISSYIFEEYINTKRSATEYLNYNKNYVDEYKASPLMENVLSNTDVKNILVSINNKVYNSQNNIIEKDLIDRKDIKINPVNNRIPVSEIQNLINWHKGFDLGFPFWEEGEKYRKEGNLKRSILLYDLARSNGYCSPALFESYAMAFHRLKDYENEIDILDEGIEREGNLGRLITRRNNAMKMLIKSRNEQKKIKENESAENILFSEIEILKRKKTRKNARPVLKMDDEMNILEHFESISDAVKKTGINSKSIRDASKGIQKHAGGFVWRYEDEYK